MWRQDIEDVERNSTSLTKIMSLKYFDDKLSLVFHIIHWELLSFQSNCVRIISHLAVLSMRQVLNKYLLEVWGGDELGEQV